MEIEVETDRERDNEKNLCVPLKISGAVFYVGWRC